MRIGSGFPFAASVGPQFGGELHRGSVHRKKPIWRGLDKGVQGLDGGSLVQTEQFSPQFISDDFGNDDFHAACKMVFQPFPAIIGLPNSRLLKKKSKWSGVKHENWLHG